MHERLEKENPQLATEPSDSGSFTVVSSSGLVSAVLPVQLPTAQSDIGPLPQAPGPSSVGSARLNEALAIITALRQSIHV